MTFKPAWLKLLFISLCFASCASPQAFKGNPTYTNDRGMKFCSLHHQPLIKAKGFAQNTEVCILPSDQYTAIAATFPNHNSEIEDQKSELYTAPIQYSYCKSCRTELAGKMKAL